MEHTLSDGMLTLGALNLVFILFLYGSIWLVPVGINTRRRKQGKRPYWMIFIASLVIELAVVYLVLLGAKAAAFDLAGLYLAPIMAAAIAGWFYIVAASKSDGRHI